MAHGSTLTSNNIIKDKYVFELNKWGITEDQEWNESQRRGGESENTWSMLNMKYEFIDIHLQN